VNNPTRIVIADSHANVRAQLVARLRREDKFEIVGEADSAAQTLEYAQTRQPDIVLIDPMMSDGLGLQAVQEIAARFPRVALIALTAAPDTALTIELRRAGVRHILRKNIASQELLQALLHTAKPQK